VNNVGKVNRVCKFTSLCSAPYVCWQRGTAHIRSPLLLSHAAIVRYLLPARRMDTVPLHRPCSAYYAGSANNAEVPRDVESRTVYAKVVKIRLRVGRFACIVLVVAAAYRPWVLRISLISDVLNADSGRYADALITHIHLHDKCIMQQLIYY